MRALRTAPSPVAVSKNEPSCLDLLGKCGGRLKEMFAQKVSSAFHASPTGEQHLIPHAWGIFKGMRLTCANTLREMFLCCGL